MRTLGLSLLATLSPLVTLSLLSPAGANDASPAPCVTTLPARHIAQAGPTCLLSAARGALSARAAPPSARALARQVPLWPDGVDPFDLLRGLEGFGWAGLAFVGPPEAAARLVEAGFAVVALVKAPLGSPDAPHLRQGRGAMGPQRHALTVSGAARIADPAGGCGTGLRSLRVHDPREAAPRWLSAQAFAARQSAGQLLVFFRPDEAPQLAARGFPLAVAQRADQRFRARALLRRAQRHGAPNGQAHQLLLRALDHDPCDPLVRATLHRSAHALGRPHPSFAPCSAPRGKPLAP